MAEALTRLGCSGALAFLSKRLDSEADWQRVKYFSLDLVSAPSARIKIYVAEPPDSPFGVLEQQTADAAMQRVAALTTANPHASTSRPILTCFAFKGTEEAPVVTVHVPIRQHARNDAESLERTSRFLDDSNKLRLERAVAAMARGPLSSERGTITYTSFRLDDSEPRITVYLAPKLYTKQRQFAQSA
jgi:hypothetical protein